MTLSPNSRIIRYALFFKGNREKARIQSISLCKLFWTCVFNTIIFSLPLAFLTAWLRLLILQPGPTLIGTGIAILVVGLIFLVAYFEDEIARWNYNRKVAKREARFAKEEARRYAAPSKWRELAKEAYWGIKNRVCPTIYIR